MRARRRLAGILLVSALLASALPGCTKPALEDRDLRQTAAVARYLTSARFLRVSAYGATMDKGTPSELVSFLFSSIGVAEWPGSEAGSAMEREQASATRTPLFAKDVPLVAANPDRRLRKQVVLKADDAKAELIAEGYSDPANPPVFTERWPLPDLSALRRR